MPIEMLLNTMKTAVDKVVEDTKDMPFGMFQTVICMALEERCLAEGEDMVETITNLRDVAVAVNSELGKYTKEDE